MTKRMRGSHRLALICIASGVTWFASSPALALDDPMVTLDSAVDAADSISTSDDLGDAAGALVDTVSSTASTTLDPVSDAASGTAGAVAGAASDAEQSVSGSAGALTDAAADGGEALGNAAANSTGTGVTGAPDPGGSSTHSVASSDSIPGVPSVTAHGAPPPSPIHRAHGRAETILTGALGEGPCSAHTSQVCSSAEGASPEESLAEKVAEIIGLLALTGLHLTPWVTAALILTIAGSLALERGRPRRARTGRAPAV